MYEGMHTYVFLISSSVSNFDLITFTNTGAEKDVWFLKRHIIGELRIINLKLDLNVR